MMDEMTTWVIQLRAGPLLDSVFTTVTVEAATRAEAIRRAKARARAEGFGQDRTGRQGSIYLARAWVR